MTFHSNLAMRSRTNRSRNTESGPIRPYKAEGYVGGNYVVRTFDARSDREATIIALRMFNASSEIAITEA